MISRRILAAAALLCALVIPAQAQKTKAQLNTEIGTSFPDNSFPLLLRNVTNDIVNSIMPAAPVVSGNLACFSGTTGLLQDCGTAPSSLSVQQTFSTLAEATAANIPSSTLIVTTLGRGVAGDNGGASYIRIAASSPAAWRFQSADGQWWALNNRSVTPEMFGCFNGTDCTAAFQSMSAWLNLGGVTSAIVTFAPGASYQVWPAGTTPSILFNFTSVVSSATFNFNGSTITTNNQFLVQGQPFVFYGTDASQLIFNDPSYRQTGYTALDFTRGGFFFYFSTQNNRNIIINNMKQFGGIAGLTVVTGNYTAAPSYNIKLFNADLDTVYYGVNFQNHGDGFFARGLKCSNCGRVYFVYGVSDHDVEIVSNGGPSAHDNVLIKQYAIPSAPVERNTLSNITVRYRNTGELAANNLPSLATLEMQQTVAPMTVTGAADNGSGKVRLTVNSTANAATGQTWFFNAIGGTTEANGKHVVTVFSPTQIDLLDAAFAPYTSGGYGSVPATMKNIHFIFDVNDTTQDGQPPALLTRKWAYDAATADTSARGYTIDNLTISGSLRDYGTGTPALSLFNNTSIPGAIGTWAGETVRNVKLHDLHIGGINSAVTIDATDLTSMMLENVNSPSTVPWTVTDPNGVVRPTNVSVTGITDRQAVSPSAAPVNQWANGLSNRGVIAYAQINFSNLAGSLACSQAPALTGDVTASAGSCVTSLPSTISAGGPTGSATVAPIITYDAKGRLTAVSSATVTPAIGSVTGLGTGVATALGTNVGSAGAFVSNGGALGTPASGTLTNATGLPISTGINGLGTGIATFLATPSSANLASALSDETGTGFAVFSVSPALTGTPTAPTAAANDNSTRIATTAYVDAAWTSYTPSSIASETVGSTAASYTVNSARYKQIGKTITVAVDVTVANQGVGNSGAILISLPFTGAAFHYVGSLVEYNTTGDAGTVFLALGATRMYCAKATYATSLIVTGYRIAAQVTYEIP